MSPPHNNTAPNGEEHDNFAVFFEHWLSGQDGDLQELLAVSAASQGHYEAAEEEEERRLRPLTERVIGHYEYYYRVKSASAKRNILPMITPEWTSSTENLFHWAGGWRPSMAFHLIYAKAGLQVEAQLAELIRGVATRDLADLSSAQLERVDQLHRRTVRLEKEISEEEAANQESLVCSDMVEMSHVITVMKGTNGPVRGGEVEMMETEIRGRREGMVRVLERADELRLNTLKGLVEILRPLQAVYFLIAAAELHLRVHEFGKRKDAAVEMESN